MTFTVIVSTPPTSQEEQEHLPSEVNYSTVVVYVVCVSYDCENQLKINQNFPPLIILSMKIYPQCTCRPPVQDTMLGHAGNLLYLQLSESVGDASVRLFKIKRCCI